MARPASSHPTDRELEILRVLWRDGPSELGKIREALEAERNREVAKTTVATMLKIMEGKGFVRRARKNKNYRWSARITQKRTSRNLIGRVVDGIFDGSTKGLVAHIIEDGHLDEAELDEIRKLLGMSERGTRRKAGHGS